MSAKVQACLLCDDFRQEVGGRATIVGFAGVLPFQGIKVKLLGEAIPPFTLLFLIEPGSTCRHVHFEHYSPSGKLVVQTPKYPWPRVPTRAPVHLPLKMNNFKPAEFGEHRLRLLCEEGQICDVVLPVNPLLPPVPPPTFGLLN